MSQLTLNEQDIAVHEYLASLGIKYACQLLAEMLHEEWQHDLFLCTFHLKNFSGPVRESLQTFEYKTGTGHRVISNNPKIRAASNMLTPRQVRDAKVYKEYSGPMCHAKHIVNRDGRREWIKCPTAASALYSLILDSEASGVSFEDWCETFGYNSDSIDALNVYKECCANAKKLHKVFKSTEIEHLQTLLEDY